jgi:DNA-binding LacI/PurR family transcriptional regulator
MEIRSFKMRKGCGYPFFSPERKSLHHGIRLANTDAVLLKHPIDRNAPSASLATVARHAGVSSMTVSRVLRNSPRVSEAARRKVTDAITAVGYQPDPDMARLMSLVRGRKRRQIQSVLAVVREERPDSPYRHVTLEEIQARAIQHGYRAEEFRLGRNGMTAERLVRVLRARGIEGVIASPQSVPQHLNRFDFSGFSSATFGYGLARPNLHRASTNMTQGILTAVDVLARRGYERIGVAITDWIDRRADHTYSGALLYHQLTTPRRHHVPLLLLPNAGLSEAAAHFCRWMKEHRPDALITFDTYVPDWIERHLGLRVPADLGLIVHDWTEDAGRWAGIDHRRTHVAAAAVDLVITQLMHHEKGIPDVPRQILIPARFVDGPSILMKRDHPEAKC